MGISALMAYRGDLVLAQGASQAGIPMIMSGSSLIRLEDVVASAPATWFQAYLPGEPERIDGLVDRVAEAGFKTLVLTVDTAALANRENNIRAGFSRRLDQVLLWHGRGSLIPDGLPARSCGPCSSMGFRTSRTPSL